MKAMKAMALMVVLGLVQTATAAPLTFTNDLVGDYTGDTRCEVYSIGSGVEDGKLYFEVRTNVPRNGFYGSDGRAYTHFSPGDVLIAVGTSDPFSPGATIHGIASSSHGNVVQQAYPGESWTYVTKGRLYTNATFADGTYENYQYYNVTHGRPYTPDDQDGNNHVNSYPSLIKYGTEVTGQSSLSYNGAGCSPPWDYKITGWVELDAIGLDCGMEYAMFYSPECGNDGAEHNGQVPCPPTGELKIVKFEDENENGVLDCSEDQLEGWQFLVEGPDSFSQVVTTGYDGTVAIGYLVPGDYTITETLQDGWELTTDNPLTLAVVADELATAYFGNTESDEPPIPEPSAGSLFLLGLLAARRRRRK